MIVVPLTGFEHYSIKAKKGVPLKGVPRSTVNDLVKRGLVRVYDETRPKKAAGIPQSASPAARPSRKKTAKKSGRGRRKRKDEES